MAPAMGGPPSDLLTVKEVEVLSKRYEVKDGQGGAGSGGGRGEAEVNYWKLCEQVEKVRRRLIRKRREMSLLPSERDATERCLTYPGGSLTWQYRLGARW